LLSDKCLRVSDYASVAQLVLGAVSMLLLCPGASALNPSLEVNQYLHRAWTHGEGFTGETRSIVQTPDGYLWLGTEFGLVRFDGVRFSSWTPPAGQRLPSNDIMSLLGTRDGTLWIGTTEGLVSFRDGRLTDYPEIAREPVFALLEDHDGAVWVGLHGGLGSIRSGKTERSEPSHLLRGVPMQSLFEDSEGRLWAAGAGSGLWQWKPGPPHQVLLASSIWPHALAQETTQ
jgi:ligand-binding sensor domain-containing protein